MFPVQISRNRGVRLLLLIEEFLVLAQPAIGSLRNPATYESPSAGEELMEGADNNVSILQLQLQILAR